MLTACATPVSAPQASPGAPSIAQLTRGADLVVIGEVTATAGEWDATRSNIYTRVHLRPLESLKGTAPAPLSFTRLGGRVGDRVSAVAGAARFAPGERVLVFLARLPDGGLRLYDLVHGKLRIERDPATGRDHAVRDNGAPGADRLDLDKVRKEVRRAPGS